MKNLNILIVDDSATTRRVTMRFLRMIGYERMIEAEDGLAGLEKLKKNPIDLVITDWNMPNMNGIEFLRSIRQDDRFKNIPVLMVTTRGLKEDVINAIKAGANNFIVKPFNQKTLEQKLDTLIKLIK